MRPPDPRGSFRARERPRSEAALLPARGGTPRAVQLGLSGSGAESLAGTDRTPRRRVTPARPAPRSDVAAGRGCSARPEEAPRSRRLPSRHPESPPMLELTLDAAAAAPRLGLSPERFIALWRRGLIQQQVEQGVGE